MLFLRIFLSFFLQQTKKLLFLNRDFVFAPLGRATRRVNNAAEDVTLKK